MEIGSEFWIEHTLNGYIERIPRWISKFGDTVLTSSGRGAISLLLSQVKVKKKTALLPAYICDSVILPFILNGYTCYFYDIKIDLSPDLKCLDTFRDIGVFFHTGYYGFPTNSNLLEIVKRFKSESAIIIEDVTHTLFSDYNRFYENDYYIASIRKWMGLPSGGFLASSMDIARETVQHNDMFANIREEALLLKSYYIKTLDNEVKSRYLYLFSKGEDILENDLSPYHIDSISATIINILNANELKEKRRANFEILSEGLKCIEYIKPVFKELSENVCPLFYPIYVEAKRCEVRQKLTEKNIYCPIHWPLPKQISYSCNNSIEQIYNTILSIPCDQRYGSGDMERLISVIREL